MSDGAKFQFILFLATGIAKFSVSTSFYIIHVNPAALELMRSAFLSLPGFPHVHMGSQLPELQEARAAGRIPKHIREVLGSNLGRNLRYTD
jgi:hypothetical protein